MSSTPIGTPLSDSRRKWPVAKGHLADMEGDTPDLSRTTTIDERFAMMWQLAQDAFAFRGETVGESSFSRHSGCLIRRGG